jgi:osmotically-inducible protein OsmY
VPDYDTQRSASWQQQNWASDNRAENPFNAQERSRQEWNRTMGAGNYGRPNYAQPSYGQERYGRREEEGWGEQIRQAGQQVVRSVKRVFRGPKGYKRSDERIREDVNDRLAQQFDFDPSDVEVQVSAGEVTLTGSVQSRHEKFLAEEIADDVGGVNEVHNQLRVRRADLTSTAATSSGATSVGSSTLGEGNNNNRNSPRA